MKLFLQLISQPPAAIQTERIETNIAHYHTDPNPSPNNPRHFTLTCINSAHGGFRLELSHVETLNLLQALLNAFPQHQGAQR